MISKNNAEHYIWGEICDGWKLVNNSDMSVIHEKMPPGTMEERHFHQAAKQFFFILIGEAEIEVDGQIHRLKEHEGIEVSPKVPHQVFNRSEQDIEFLVISTPPTAGDRVKLE